MRFLPLVVIVAVLLPASGARACIAGLDEPDEPPPPPSFIQRLKSHYGVEYWLERVQERLNKANKTWDPEAEVDLSAALAHAQKYDEALKHAEAAERSRPGMYATAANIGTLYELKGDVPRALWWINEGVNRNPYSLHATEWLHLRILEAKIQLAKDPKWLETHSVLGMDFGTRGKPEEPKKLPSGNRGKEISLDEVEKAVIYQLHERLEFVSAPDPIVADLLVDLGNMQVSRGDKDDAREVFKLALEYGPAQPQVVEARLYWLNGTHDYRPLGVLLSLGLMAGVAYWYKRLPRYEPARVQPWDGPEPPATWDVGESGMKRRK